MLAPTLLIGAGLFLATLTNLNSVDVGFNTNNLLIFKINPALSGYKKEQIHKILGGNVLRVFRDAEKVSREMQRGTR